MRCADLRVDLRCHLVHAKFDDRHIRRCRFEHVMQSRARKRELRASQWLEAAAEADDHQVGFVTEHLHERRGPRVGHRQRVICLICEAAPVAFRHAAKAIPADAIHEVQDAPPLERFGNKGVVHGRDRNSRNPKTQIPNPKSQVATWEFDLQLDTSSRSIVGSTCSAAPRIERSTRGEAGVGSRLISAVNAPRACATRAKPAAG